MGVTGEYAAKWSQLTDFQEAKQKTRNLSVVNYQSSMYHVDVTATTVVVSSSTASCRYLLTNVCVKSTHTVMS